MFPEHVLVFSCDKADVAKPHMVTDYVDEIYKYYKDMEVCPFLNWLLFELFLLTNEYCRLLWSVFLSFHCFFSLCRPQTAKAPTLYMHSQADINARMRAILIDWLVEVHLKFKLVPTTLYLCVNLIDQYCSSNAVQRSKLQLVGVTALLVACKFEEIYPPEVRDCVYITDHAYTREEVLGMEMKMLEFFGYNVAAPTSYQFLVRFLRIGGYSLTSRTAHRASYFSERCLQEHEMLSYKPSLLAASVVYLATSMDKADAWVSKQSFCFEK
jgi:cyclin B